MSKTATSALFELGRELAVATQLAAVRSAVVDHLGLIVPSRAHAIYELLHSGRPANIDTSPGVPNWFLDAYEGEGRPSDPIYAEVRRSHRPADSGSLLHWRRWREEPVYGVLDRVGFHRSLQAPIVVGCHLHATLNLARSNDDPPFSAVDLARLDHVRTLVGDVYARVVDAEAFTRQGDLYVKALDTIAEPVVVSSRLGETLLLNRAARKAATADGETLASLCRSVIVHNARELQETGTESVRRTLDLPGVGHITVRTAWLAHDDQPTVISYLYRRGRSGASPPLEHSPLTARERELVALVGQGLTVHEIAAEAFISANTVKQHLKRIYAKLGVHSRAELVQALWESSLAEATPAP